MREREKAGGEGASERRQRVEPGWGPSTVTVVVEGDKNRDSCHSAGGWVNRGNGNLASQSHGFSKWTCTNVNYSGAWIWGIKELMRCAEMMSGKTLHQLREQECGGRDTVKAFQWILISSPSFSYLKTKQNKKPEKPAFWVLVGNILILVENTFLSLFLTLHTSVT